MTQPEIRFEIGLLTFEGVQQLDLTAPYEVFASLPGARVHLVGRDRATVTSATGLPLTPTTDLAACPDLDLLCVPGGIGVNALMTDAAVLAFLRAQAARPILITSVCTGALVLGAAGLLAGRRATTHWNALDLLPAFGATPVDARIVRDGRLITGGGVTAGLDFALAAVAELAGRHDAETIQLALEYAPAPPFSAGHPGTASAEVVAAARARLSASRAAREAIIAGITGAEAQSSSGSGPAGA